MGILDLIAAAAQGGNGPGGLLGALFGAQQPQKPAYDWMLPNAPVSPLSGLGANKYQIAGYLAGALQPGTVNEQISRGLMGFMSGAQNDLLTQQRLDALANARQQRGTAAALIDKVQGLTPEQKRFFADNPKAWEEYSKALVNSPTTTIGNTVLQGGPFQAPKPVYVEPYKPELVEGYDPGSGRRYKAPYQLPQPHGVVGVVGAPPAAGAQRIGASTAAPGAVGAPSMQSPGVAGGFYSGPSEQEKEEATQVGQGLGQDYIAIQKQASNAIKTRSTLQRLSQLSPKAYEGAGAPALQYVRSYLATYGVDPGKVPAGEEFTALANQLVLDATGGSLGNQISNSDRDFIAARFPQLTTTAAGRKEMIDTIGLLKQREIDTAKLATEYRKQNGSMQGFTTYLADYAEKNPLFVPEGATATNPKTGARIIKKDGKWQPMQ